MRIEKKWDKYDKIATRNSYFPIFIILVYFVRPLTNSQ